ncbi:helix-turn-helix transcriptional regulator [Desulforamulus ruminis]|uniref:Transcriptional regulator, XRE family n=1 Tax=Desulforamulus ruminis (strain ATCC 23193 / DSM 2154 / NCIMB 8452 / DL) TaxID=696281 RepID=F6DTX4_DESRL|nr:XRE family transcriptional regulator [Desulforamulus ruminis]AEG58992.1 transcriptional regulator, XRE family [Desulforamulus ruminis DSM 2154]
MDFSLIKIPKDMEEVLNIIYLKAKKLNPGLTESLFLQRILEEWLEPYKRETSGSNQLPRSKVVLRNKVKAALEFYGKAQKQVARDVGIDRSYLCQIANNAPHDLSVKIAFLIADSIGYPKEKFRELFYLESAEQE